MAKTPTLQALARSYREGTESPRDVAEQMLARLEAGDTVRVVMAERARAQAAAAQRRWERGDLRGPLDGVPLVLKDLIDTAGEVTAAGSAARFGLAPASQDAPVVARLDQAGAVFLGKSTMTELAFGGLGLNPHTGTPGNALDPTRVPGGSSSGSAVAVARGLAIAALGSDTGGSVRIPAAFNDLVGLKTTDGSLPMAGTVPLSTTLDTLGPIARTVADAHVLYQAMADLPSTPLTPVERPGRFWAPADIWQEDLDPGVAQRFGEALSALEAAGHSVHREPLGELRALDALYGRFGSFAAHEAWALYEQTLAEYRGLIDPRVSSRIEAVAGRPASDYIRLGYERQRGRAEVWSRAEGFDALLAPTVRSVPPLVAPLEGDDGLYMSTNLQVLRNTALGNLLGCPSLTLPLPLVAGLPVGFMLSAAPGRDGLLLRWGEALMPLLQPALSAPIRGD